MLIADLTDHETGFYDINGPLNTGSTKYSVDREYSRTLSNQADGLTGLIVGSDGGKGSVLNSDSYLTHYKQSSENIYHSDVAGDRLYVDTTGTQSGFSASYDSSAAAGQKYQGSRVSVDTSDSKQEFTQTGAYLNTLVFPAASGLSAENGWQEYHAVETTTESLGQDQTWSVTGDTIASTASGLNESTFTDAAKYSRVVDAGPYQNRVAAGVKNNAQWGKTSFSSTRNAALDLVTDTWAETGDLLSVVDSTLSSNYSGSGQYSRPGSATAGEYGPDGLKATGWLTVSQGDGTFFESGSSKSATHSQVNLSLDPQGGWVPTSGTGTADLFGDDRQGHTVTANFSHPVGANGYLFGTRTDTQEDGTSYSITGTSTYDPLDGKWTPSEALVAPEFGSSQSEYSGSGQYDSSWYWSDPATLGPEGLTTNGRKLFRRQGTATESGLSDSSYRHDLNSELAPDGTWQVVSGQALAKASGQDHQGLSGGFIYGYYTGHNGWLVGSKAETQTEAITYTAETPAILNVTDGSWASTGYRDTQASGSAKSSYAGSGNYDGSWYWGAPTTFGPEGLTADGRALYRRQGTATDSGSAESKFNYDTRQTLTPGGVWSFESGTGNTVVTSEDHQGLSGTFVYWHPVGANGGVSGTKNEAQDDAVILSAKTAAVLDPATGLWATSGDPDSAAVGWAKSDYKGSGSYDNTWWGTKGTFGPSGLTAEGNPLVRRHGAASESGTAEMSYRYDPNRTLAASGLWNPVSGSGSMTFSAIDEQWLSGSRNYWTPIGGNTWLVGTQAETQSDGRSYQATLTSELNPQTDTWGTTGSLVAGAYGAASSKYQGSGSYDYAWWGDQTTFGPSGLSANGTAHYRRQGTATDSGHSDTKYDYQVFHSLGNQGAWQITGGTGTVSTVQENRDGLTGTLAYRYPVAANGTVFGVQTESQDDGVVQIVDVEATLDPVSKTWAATGNRTVTATGFSDSSSLGSGGYDNSWWGAKGAFGPHGLTAVGNPYYRRQGTATDSGYAKSSYQYDVTDALTGQGKWQTVSGTLSSEATAESHKGLSGTLAYSYPVGANGTVSGVETQSQDEGSGYSLLGSAAWDATNSDWATTGSLDTKLFGTTITSDVGSGSYDNTWWGDRGTNGPTGLAVVGDPRYHRQGTVTVSGSSNANYLYDIHSAVGADRKWVVTGGSGTTSATGDRREGLSGTLTYVYPVVGGDLSGLKIESQDDGASYSMSSAATLDSQRTWAVTGALDSGADGYSKSSYLGSGTYEHVVGAHRVSGVVFDAGSQSSTYQQNAHSVLDPDGKWLAVSGKRDEAGTTANATSYAGDGTFNASIQNYFVGTGSGNATGGVVESWAETSSANYDTHHLIGVAGTWEVGSGNSSSASEGSGKNSFSIGGSYTRNATSGIWAVTQKSDMAFLSTTTGVLGKNGEWATTGSSHTGVNGGGVAVFTGSSSTTESGSNGNGSTWSSSSDSNESFNYVWTDTWAADSTLSLNGVVSTVTTKSFVGNGTGGGGSNTAAHESTTWSEGESSKQSNSSTTWTMALSDSHTERDEATTIISAGGKRVRTGSITGTESHNGSVSYQVNGSTSSHLYGFNGVSTSTRDGVGSFSASGGDGYNNRMTWGAEYTGDTVLSRSSSFSGEASGHRGSTGGSSWTHDWNDGHGNGGTDSGSEQSSGSDTYNIPNHGGAFGGDFYSYQHGAVVQSARVMTWWDSPESEPTWDWGPPDSAPERPQPSGLLGQLRGLMSTSTTLLTQHVEHARQEAVNRHANGDTWAGAVVKSWWVHSGNDYVTRNFLEAGGYAIDAVRYVGKSITDPVQDDVRGYQAAGYPFFGFSYLPRRLAVINNLPWLSIPNRIFEVAFGRSLSGRDFGRYLTTGERVTTATFVVLDLFFLASLYKKPLLAVGQRLFGLLEREAAARNLANVRWLEEAAKLLTNTLARGTTGCFAAGTPVMTPDGSKAIESLRVGDAIYSRDQHDPAAPLDVQHVEQVFRKIAPLWTASIGGQPIRMTSEHPLYVQDVGWVPLREIRVGAAVLGMNGEWVTIAEVTPSDVAVEVYNIQVASHHTFFIGDALWGFSVWVHNEQICDLLARVLSTAGNPAEH